MQGLFCTQMNTNTPNPINNKVIYTGASGLGAGHDLSVYVTANGKEYGEYCMVIVFK